MQPVGLYCNRRGLDAGSSVLQYTALYCNLGARQGWTVLQYSAQSSHNTATVATTRRWAGVQVLGVQGAGLAGAWHGASEGQAAGRAGSGLGAAQHGRAGRWGTGVAGRRAGR